MIFLNKRKIGGDAEDLACEYLIRLGYKILDRNFLIRGGEIDIVALEGVWLVFVEVKARYSHEYGLPEESITPWKIKSLKKCALFYIQKIKWGERPYRFDLVTLDFTEEKDNQIRLLQNIIS